MARRRDRGKGARMLNSMVSFLLQADLGGEPEPITAALADVASRIWGVSLVLIWTVDKDSDQLQLASVSGADSSKAEGVVRVDEPFVKELMRRGRPVVVRDLSREPRWGNRTLLEVTAHKALLGAPLVVDGRSVGAFVLLSPSPERFTSWDDAILGIFARHLATAKGFYEVPFHRVIFTKVDEGVVLGQC